MKICKCNNQITCDIKGCSNLTAFYVKKDELSSDSDALKICKNCAKSLLKTLEKAIKDKESLWKRQKN